MMLFRRGNRKKSTYRTPLIWRLCAFHDALQAGKQKEVHPPYSHPYIMKGARFADVAAI
jgi:hypothetical protein